MTGKYIVVEGYDGSGKSTLAANLEKALDQRGVPTLRIGFPSNSGAIGRFIRSSFAGDTRFDRKAYLPLMIADGLDHEEPVRAWVQAGGVFIADRHTTFSAFVYQTEDFSEATVASMFSLFDWRKPDLAILVDAPVEVAMKRQRSRKEQIDVVWEKDDIEYNMRLREKYLGLFARYDGKQAVLDGTLAPDELTKQALALLSF